MWQTTEETFEENKISLIGDRAEKGLIVGSLLYDGQVITSFSIQFTFNEDNDYDGFSIHVPEKGINERFSEEDCIGMIEYGIFEEEETGFYDVWTTAYF